MTENKGRNDWETPFWLFDRLHDEFRFDVDAAAQPHNAKLPTYWTPEQDGLRQPWAGLRVFCNPPYLGGRKAHWVGKAASEVAAGHCPLAVLVLPADTESFWWHDIVMPAASEIRFIRGRIHFLLNGKRAPNSRPVFNSAVIVFSSFRPAGLCVATSLVAPDPRTLHNGRTKAQQGQMEISPAEAVA